MTVTISAVMMAHPKRKELAESIVSQLDRDVPIIWDEKNSRWDTGKRAMLAYDPDCTHHAVIQDDVLVCRDLFAGLEVALSHIPDNVPVCGYVGRVRPYAEMVTNAARRARTLGASWLTMHTLNWGPLIVVPTDIIPEMIAHCDRLRDIPNYDRRLSRYWELERHLPIYYTWPSVVDHADGPSLVPGRIGTDRGRHKRNRVAHTFVGEDASALDIDWTGVVVNAESAHPPAGRVVVYRHRRTGQELHLSEKSPRIRRMRGVPQWERIEG